MSNINKVFTFETQQNSIDLLYNDDDIMITSIDLFHIDNKNECNRNHCNISLETAEKSLHTIFNKPIICRFNSQYKDFVTDVTEHARNDKELFLTQVAGHIPSDARVSFIKRENNKTYCNVEAIIQKKYMPELVKIIKEKDNSLKVSIEIKAKGYSDEDDIFIIESFILQAVCLLGENVIEGIEGSQMKVLKFSKKEIDTMNDKYLKFTKLTKSCEKIGQLVELQPNVIDSALIQLNVDKISSVVNKVEELYQTIKKDKKEGNMENEKNLQNQEESDTSQIDNSSENVDLDLSTEKQQNDISEEIVENSVKEESQNNNSKEEDKIIDEDDKDSWKEKYNQLDITYKNLAENFKKMETEFTSCQEQLKTYKLKEDKEEMKKYLNTYKKCFSEEELNVMAKKIENTDRLDFEKEVDEKIREFVKNLSKKNDCQEDDDIEVKNSYGNMFNPETKVAKTNKKTIDDVLDYLK